MTDNTNETNEQQPTTGTQPGNQAGQDKTFTQADVDRLIKERLERQEKSILSKYGDPKAAKDALARLKELEEAGKTEAQRMTDALTDKETRLSIAESGWQRAQIDNAVILEALRQGVAPDRLQAALKLFDDKAISRSDDGTLTGLDTAVTKLLEENPFLKPEPGAAAKPPAPKVGATNPQGSGQSSDIRSWHPLTRHAGGGGFGGQIVYPSEGDKPK